ncbi:MAG: SdrD B-like domain-containing protein [Acidobacteriota bacterium]
MKSVRPSIGLFVVMISFCALSASAQIPGAIQTLDASGAARRTFAHREDVFLAAGSAATPCRAAEYLTDGDYYFQVTDSTGRRLLSVDPVSQRRFTVRHGVIEAAAASEPSLPRHLPGPASACGSASLGLAPFADVGPGEASYVVWVTPVSSLDGDPNSIDPVCGDRCFHGFRAESSRLLAFRVEDKRNCQPTFCASGAKFQDANGNGVRDSGEAGIPGVEIDFDSGNGVVLSGLTGPDGSYQVCGLTDGGTFRATESVPFGFLQTGPLDHRLSRRVVARDLGYLISFCDANVSGLDFGNQALPNAIGGTKFEDLNANGLRDPGEPGLAGVSISLFPGVAPNPTGVSRTVVTDTNGNFLFTNSAAGPFFLVETPPAGFTQTTPASGSIGGTLAAGGSSLDNVFGNFRGALTGAVSGLKFLDANGNGLQDEGEGPQPGVTFTISGPAGFTPVTAVTGADGRFNFASIPFGTYTVTETVPAGFEQTAPPAPGTATATLSVSQTTVSNLVFGNHALASPATIGGTKFIDANGSGARDPGEGGAAGVVIRLQGPGAAGPTVQTTTAADGSFSFPGLAPGAYSVSEVVPTGFVQTVPGGGGFIPVTVASGQVRNDLLFGNRIAAPGVAGAVAGIKFLDLNTNGVIDGIDRPLAGIVFVLTASDGSSRQVTSGADGTFLFDGVTPGVYVLSEILPDNFAQTFPGTPSAPQTYTVTVTAGQTAGGFLFLNKC